MKFDLLRLEVIWNRKLHTNTNTNPNPTLLRH